MQNELMVLALFGPIGMPEMIVIALLGLLIFGRRLPEVGRGLGKSIIEFKRGLADVKDEVEEATKELPSLEEATRLPDTGSSQPAPPSAKNDASAAEGVDAPPPPS
jgi:sec-independent protein translocase protein TatA